MTQEPQAPATRKGGLAGTLKLAFAIAVILFAGLAILLAMGTISRNAFNDYLTTLLIVIVIGTAAAVLIALLTRPGKP